MKLWLDDVREAPKGWTWVKDYNACIELVATGKVSYLSLDHDLGTIKSGYDVARWIEHHVWVENFIPPIIEVHSANPVGRQNILACVASIKRAQERVG